MPTGPFADKAGETACNRSVLVAFYTFKFLILTNYRQTNEFIVIIPVMHSINPTPS